MAERLLQVVMTLNAAIFFFAALEHAGIAIGPFSEPIIIPAAIVESVCGLLLAWGVTAVSRWRIVLITNLIALGGVLLGIAALAAGRGPRTASNDLHHGIMLSLIVVSLIVLFFRRKDNQ